MYNMTEKAALDRAKKNRQQDYELSNKLQDELIEQELDKRGLKGLARGAMRMKMGMSGFGEGLIKNGQRKPLSF